MDFITIREGLKINPKKIESVEEMIGTDIAQTKSVIIIMESGKSHVTSWPLESLMMLLEIQDIEPIQTVKLEPEINNALTNMDHFAG